MAVAKKAADITEKSVESANDTKLKTLGRASKSGYYIFKGKDGIKSFKYISKGYAFRSYYGDLLGFAESNEEASALACVPFVPVGIGSFSEKTKTEFNERHDRIGESVVNIDNSALKVAFDLHWVDAKKAYIIKSFATIADYAKFYFGYEKTSCYSLIAVVDRFAKRDKDGNILEEIAPAYSAYTSSKLSLMVNLTDDQITANLKPSMSVREIKKIVKTIEDKALTDQSKDSGNRKEDTGEENTPPDQSGTDTGKDTIVDSTAKEIRRNTLFTYKGADDYGRKFNVGKVNDQISLILKDHPDALIEISYTLP